MDLGTIAVASLLYLVPCAALIIAIGLACGRNRMDCRFHRWEFVAPCAPLFAYLALVQFAGIDNKGWSVLWELVLIGIIYGVCFGLRAFLVSRSPAWRLKLSVAMPLACTLIALAIGVFMPGFGLD
ncbi:MAG: hypothetical protein K1X71_02940 [Pirellulales bacterium]|nr:hypothetical protein [Pirellulales bacterium]